MVATLDDLIAVAHAHGLNVRAERAKLDETGADFLVAHLVDAEDVPWVVRSPRRADVLERAEAERRVLDLVRARLPVAVPDWRVFAPEIIAYSRLGGHPAAVVDLEAGGYVWRFDETAPPQAFTDTLGDALAALHRIPEDEAAGAGVRVKRSDEIRAAFGERMEGAREVLDVPEVVWRRWQEWIADDTYWPEHSVLVHGDLHPAHVLVDDGQRVTGLLDWTEAHIGDPATDFAILYATMGAGPLGALLKRYEAAGGRTWPRMRAHIVETWAAYPSVIAEFARLSGEDAPRQLGQMLVNATAQEMAG